MRDFSGENMTEAENMYEKIIELGVPEASIIMEKESQNTIENILCALLELQRSMWLNRVNDVLLVTTTYHMRRSLHIAKYFFPSHINAHPCPANDINTRRDNWMNTPEGVNRVTEEALNIIRYVNSGVIPDFEI